jgi:hypothetical protein
MAKFPVALGDSQLSFDMSDAAAYYGVPPDVVPKRTRMGQSEWLRKMRRAEEAEPLFRHHGHDL